MRQSLNFLVISLAVLVYSAPSQAVAGGNSTYVRSEVTLPDNHTAATLVQASIAKGLAKHVLEVIVTVFQPRGPSHIDVFTPLVNGVAFMNGSTDASIDCPGTAGTTSCPVTIMWFLDLDEAEAAFPGQIIGQQLNISLSGFDINDTGPVVTSNMAARLEAK